MIGLLDVAPDTAVQDTEYVRLLGYPRGHVLADRALELARLARTWYAEHGRPWTYVRRSRSLDIEGNIVVIDGEAFTSGRLARTLRDAGADSVALVALSAGPELERKAADRWQAAAPDEYYFLEVLGSAMVEHLVMMAGARLCATADVEGHAVLPHYSPGYPEWNIADQGRLLALTMRDAIAHPLEALDSGMLRPKKSLLAVFGLTRSTERVPLLTSLLPCQCCSLPRCQYRRAAYLAPRTQVVAGA